MGSPTQEFELGVGERLQLLEVLPAEGDVTALRIIRSLREELSFSEAEHQAFKIETTQLPDGRQTIKWEIPAEKPKRIKVGVKALAMITEALEEKNRQKKLPLGYLPLYEKFIGNGHVDE